MNIYISHVRRGYIRIYQSRGLCGAACPITGSKSSSRENNTSPVPQKHVSEIPGPPILPLIGSLGDAIIRKKSLGNLMGDYYNEHGPIIKHKLVDEEVVLYDPNDILKVFRAEGKYPRGASSDFWPFTRYCTRNNMQFFSQKMGEEWKTGRMKMQADILSPQAAASYLPSLYPVVQQASKAFPSLSHDMDQFCRRAVFDMFTAAVIGKSRNLLQPELADPRDMTFLNDATEAFRLAGVLAYSPYENFMSKNNISTALWTKFSQHMHDAFKRSGELAEEAVGDIGEKINYDASATMSEMEEDVEKVWDGVGQKPVHETECYLKRLLKRGALSPEQAGSELGGLLFAAVDTTSAVLMWNLVNLAANPDKQAILANELKEKLNGADYHKDVPLPYMQACYRETQRFTPANTTIGFRVLDTDISLRGYTIPAGMRINFNTKTIQADPRVVDNADKYMPERWLPDAVSGRKGTPAEVLDHRLLATPFSFGPRMCLGGRLAEVEMFSLICRLVQDYEFTIAEDSPPYSQKEFLFTTPFPVPKFSATPRKYA